MITQLLSVPSKVLKNELYSSKYEDFCLLTQNRNSFSNKIQELKTQRKSILGSLKTQTLRILSSLGSTFYQEDIQNCQNMYIYSVESSKVITFRMNQHHQRKQKSDSTLLDGLCEVYFGSGSYLLGVFTQGHLTDQYRFVDHQGNYIQIKQIQASGSLCPGGGFMHCFANLQLDHESEQHKFQQILNQDIDLDLSRQNQDLTQKIKIKKHKCSIKYNNISYEGYLKDQKLQGKVQEKGSNYTFSGTYFHGQRMFGLLKTDQFQYQGQFKNNMFHGFGELKINGQYYTGRFQTGHKNGQGQYYWKDGSFYKGEFKDDLRNGKGYYKSSVGQYKGLWKDDQINGNGYIIVDGKGIGGKWCDNQYQMPTKYF